MRELILSRYNSRFDKKKGVKQKLSVNGYQWAAVVKLLSDFVRTKETFAEYMGMESLDKLAVKDVGYFVGGEFDPPYRSTFNLVSRDLLTLDADHLGFLDILEFKETYGKYAYLIHSSHSHSGEKPRLRIVFPFSRPVTPEEYEPIARMVANMLDMELFDDTTYQFSRIMFLPSVAADGEIYTETNDGEWLDPDAILGLYEDWEDVGSWPRSSRQQLLRAPTMRAQNPFEKPGIIGEFNRAYSIDEAIINFELPYEDSGQGDGRYTYTAGTSADGAVYYPDDGHLYSHHESDPAHGNHNAWDLVRLHKFCPHGDDTEGSANVMQCPSMQQMVLLACGDSVVQAAAVGEMFDDVTEEAEGDEETGAQVSSVSEKPTVKNAEALTYNDVFEWIQRLYNTPDLNFETIGDEFFTLVALANLGVAKTEMLVVAYQDFLKSVGIKISKQALIQAVKAMGKDLVTRGGEGDELKDIQMEFLTKFEEEYYVGGEHLKRTGKQWWTYTGTHWARRSDEYVSGQLAKILVSLRTNPKMRKEAKALAAAVGESQTSTIHNSLWSMFQATKTMQTESQGVEADPMGLMRTGLPKVINCLNGTIEFRDDGKYRLRKSNPEDLFTSVVEAEFDRDAKCPTWDLYCRDAFSRATDPRAVQRHLEEVIGYTLNQSRHLRAWVLLYGGTGSGKSTIGEVLGFLLGDAAKFMPFSNYSGGNSHATAGLIGKQMVFDDDYKAGDLLPDGILKTISEEKRLEANPKGKEEFAFVARCVPYICTNNAPTTRDSSGALADRALVFPFDHLIPFNERDPEMRNMLKAEAEGILARCVKAFARLVKRKHWEFPADCTTAWRKWVNQSNTINMFIEECLVPAEGEHVKAIDVWEAYRMWWRLETGNNGNNSGRNKTGFYTALEQALEQARVRHATDAYIWRGWKLDDKFIRSDDFDD